MARMFSKFRKFLDGSRELLDEKGWHPGMVQSRLQKFVHFWILVWRSFNRNRCPIRASALSYVTLLSLIPLMAVAISITSSLLKSEGEERIQQFIEKLVASMTPPGMLGTNDTMTVTDWYDIGIDEEDSSASAAGDNLTAVQQTGASTNEAVLPSYLQGEDALQARKTVARNIHRFIQNTRSGTLGITGTVLLIFTAISLLSRIEMTFNDIWGVARGRGWFMRIVLYWGVISLAPILLVTALGLATGPHLESTRELIKAMPFISNLMFQFLPVVLLCLTFVAFYMLMPNTKVDWQAALVGGLVGGALFHLNNMASVLYVSRVVSSSKIYGSLGLVPVFMVGLYFSWLILLFGAQVAYAFQNRVTYLEERQAENINQRGREFIALRLMTTIGQRFDRGKSPPTASLLGEELCVPSRLARQILQTLINARLVVETAGVEPGYLPARPLADISCHDILQAIRASQGQELATRDEPVRVEVLGEFCRIQEAERQAAASVSMLALVNRAEERIERPQLNSAAKPPPGGGGHKSRPGKVSRESERS
jgi:membrane protein